jgi:hypothetical protein
LISAGAVALLFLVSDGQRGSKRVHSGRIDPFALKEVVEGVGTAAEPALAFMVGGRRGRGSHTCGMKYGEDERAFQVR